MRAVPRGPGAGPLGQIRPLSPGIAHLTRYFSAKGTAVECSLVFFGSRTDAPGVREVRTPQGYWSARTALKQWPRGSKVRHQLTSHKKSSQPPGLLVAICFNSEGKIHARVYLRHTPSDGCAPVAVNLTYGGCLPPLR